MHIVNVTAYAYNVLVIKNYSDLKMRFENE